GPRVGGGLAPRWGGGRAPVRVVLLGFRRGGCFALKSAARNARRYGGVVGLSAGLIGPPGTPRNYPGTLAGTPAFVGCSDADFHIPLARVHESTDVLRRLGGGVPEGIYPRLGHTINDDEAAPVRRSLAPLAAAEPAFPGAA